MATPSLYYQDDAVSLWHGDCREVLADLDADSVAAVLTDPPYTDKTHAGAMKKRTSSKTSAVIEVGISTFSSITDDDLRSIVSEMGRVSRGWVVATLDYRHAVEFDVDPPRGLKVQRLGVWVKTNPTPQITGDRPAQGWEAIAYMHRSGVRSKWNGGGAHGNYVAPIPRPEGHPTAKPLPLVAQWVRWFSNPGDTVLDPFAGSGTTLRAAKDEGRKAIGVELDERYCEVIARRLSQDTLFGGVA
jgi:site-specific DNA-methyltransferase (adenine-specific)